jgi:hypothetical protein
MNDRGGMCPNPFGGRTRLDRLDFASMVGSQDEPEKAVFLQTICDAIHNYLFFGLGRNGTTIEEFAYAYEYLFVIQSTDSDTWKTKRTARVETVDERTGKKRYVKVQLGDEEIMGMCFDKHYEYAQLGMHMPIDTFRSWLKRERDRVLKENQDQVWIYLDHLRARELQKLKRGQQLPLLLVDRMLVLKEPSSMKAVAELVYIPTQYTQPLLQEG